MNSELNPDSSSIFASLKDKISIMVSILALAISIYATVIGQMNGKAERERTIRNQLSDVLGRIPVLIMEDGKLFQDSELDRVRYETKATSSESIKEKDVLVKESNIKMQYTIGTSSLLNQQIANFLEEANYLTEQIPSLVSPVEYNTLAIAFAKSGQFFKADAYYRKAIDLSSDDYMKSLMIRSYAIFIFPQGRIPEARKFLEQSLILLKGSDNQVLMTNGQTCQIWGTLEKTNGGNLDESNRRFQEAASYFNRITIEQTRFYLLTALEAAKSQKYETNLLYLQSNKPTPSLP